MYIQDGDGPQAPRALALMGQLWVLEGCKGHVGSGDTGGVYFGTSFIRVCRWGWLSVGIGHCRHTLDSQSPGPFLL